MNASEASSSVRSGDLRAPLATFDTVDFGEDRSSMQALHNNSFEFKSEIESTNSEASLPNDCFAFNDDFGSAFSADAGKSCEQDDVWSEVTITTKSESDHPKLSKKNSFGYLNLKERRTSLSSDSSDSSDSDRGYMKSGYVTVSSNSDRFPESAFPCDVFDSPMPQRAFLRHVEENNSSCESTPFSSPNLSRSSLPSLIQELETVTEISKRKALQKRIQRLQVTNKPVERPRSTTPINVVNLEEYKSPSSSPSINSEKLSIKLPPEEYRKRHKSPAKLQGDIFSFTNEDLLFTRTKSLVVETATLPGQSPKRVLIPPTLSPSSSPCVSPRKSERHIVGKSQKGQNVPDVLFSTSPDKWVAFPDDRSDCQNYLAEGLKGRSQSISDIISHNVTCPEDDVLTIHIVESDNTKECDISLETNSVSDGLQLGKKINNTESSQGDNKNLCTGQIREMTLNESETSDLRHEIISIVNEIFDGESNLPQVFHDNEERREETGTEDRINCAKEENNSHNTHLLIS